MVMYGCSVWTSVHDVVLLLCTAGMQTGTVAVLLIVIRVGLMRHLYSSIVLHCMVVPRYSRGVYLHHVDVELILYDIALHASVDPS